MKFRALAFALAASLTMLFFVAFGYFCLLQQWDTALKCLVFAFVGGGAMFIWSALDNEAPY